MAGPKFFIYGGSRWREVNTTSGQVVGWGKVQFLSVSQGRLQVARTSSVLRGLRNLAYNKPTSVHDGLPLSQIRHTKAIEENYYKEDQCRHHCCCQQQINCKLDQNLVKAPTTSSAAIQCTLTQTKPAHKKYINSNILSNASNTEYDVITLEYPKVKFKKKTLKRLVAKRKKSASDNASVPLKTYISSEDKETSLLSRRREAKAKIVKNIQNNLDKSNKRKHSTSENESGNERSKKISKSSNLNKKVHSEEQPESLKLLRRSIRGKSNSKNELNQTASPSKASIITKSIHHSQKGIENKNISPKKLSRKKQRNSTITVSSDDSIEVSPSIIRRKFQRRSSRLSRHSKVNDADKPFDKISNNKNNTQTLQNMTNGVDKPSTRKIFNFSIDSDTDDAVQQVTTTAQMHIKPQNNRIENKDSAKSKEKSKKIYKKSKTSNKYSKYLKHKVKPTRKQSSDDSNSIVTATSKEPFKELFISEDDVMLLRSFVEKDPANVFNVDLERFDSDDIYKSRIFYKINPLVNVVRSRRIGRLLKQRRSENTVSLEDFISTLGLRSVLDTSSQASSKYKMRSRLKPVQKSSEDKENKKLASKTVNKRDKVFSDRVNNNEKSIVPKTKPRLSDLKSNEKVASESDSNFEGSRKVSKERLKRPKPVIAVKRGLSKPSRGNREYSRAEDEAIVLWVRKGGHASRVKGNQVWREMQPDHQQATGLFRSWHSLRNRYLRYLLPALGSLSLSPSEASRLRAAAAAGNVKPRKDQRENSILRQPRVHSAWSRRPRNLSPPRRSSSNSSSAPRRSPPPSRRAPPPSRRSPPPSRRSPPPSRRSPPPSRRSPPPSRRSPPPYNRSTSRYSSAPRRSPTRSSSPSPPRRSTTSPKRSKPSSRRSRSPPSGRFSPPSRRTSNYSSQSIVSDTDSSSERSKRAAVTRSSGTAASNVKTKRTLRSSNITSPTHTNTHIRVPTYSELTKKYATKPDDDSFTDKQLRSRKSDNRKPGTRRLYNPNNI